MIHLREWRGLAGQIFPMARVADWPDSYFQWRTIFTGNFGPPDQNFHGKNGPPGPILPGPKLQCLCYFCSAVQLHTSTVVDSAVLGSDMVVEPFVGRETAVIKIIYCLWYILAWLI